MGCKVTGEARVAPARAGRRGRGPREAAIGPAGTSPSHRSVGTTWTVRNSTVGACKEHMVQAVGDMAASHGILVICDYSDGTGMVIIGGHLNPPPSFDLAADVELNCSLGARPGTGYRVLRFVDLP